MTHDQEAPGFSEALLHVASAIADASQIVARIGRRARRCKCNCATASNFSAFPDIPSRISSCLGECYNVTLAPANLGTLGGEKPMRERHCSRRPAVAGMGGSRAGYPLACRAESGSRPLRKPACVLE
jgi:hypothetical protein